MNNNRSEIDIRCRVHLEQFEGPLDLLLYLIKRDEIDIYDIPITHVVREFGLYLNRMKDLDLAVAGEYLLMASLLMSIKARMLLPKPEVDTSEIEDPRMELVEMLIEYQRYKKLSEKLERKREEQMRQFPKGAYPDSRISMKYVQEQELIPLDTYSLIKAAWDLLKQKNQIIPGEPREKIDIGERITYIQTFLAENGRGRFVDLFVEKTTPLKFVATFIALLELIKQKKIRVHQQSQFGNIWIYPNPEGRGD